MDNNTLRDIKQQLDNLKAQLATTSQQPRAEYAGGVARKASVDISAGQAGRLWYDTDLSLLVIDAIAQLLYAGYARSTFASFPAAQAGVFRYATDRLNPDTVAGVMYVGDASTWNPIGVGYALPVYTVASLPAAPSTQLGQPIAFASNGRKGAEGAGAGTGVPVYWNIATSSWYDFFDNAQVQA